MNYFIYQNKPKLVQTLWSFWMSIIKNMYF